MKWAASTPRASWRAPSELAGPGRSSFRISHLCQAPSTRKATVRATGSAEPAHDVVLSSGFLAFAQHSGFLQAVEEAGIPVAGVMGTSAGALTGSLYAAGYSPREVATALSERAPIEFLRPCFEPWRGGVLSLEGVVERLRELLPPTFDGLQRDFAVGVVTSDGRHVIIDNGPLPEAVAASAAIPFIFSNVDVPGVLPSLKDGGVVDRVGLAAWRQRRRQQAASGMAVARSGGSQTQQLGMAPPPCLVHIIERSSPFSGTDDADAAGESQIEVVRCPKSGVNFFDLGDFERQFEDARGRASTQLSSYSCALPASGVGAAVHPRAPSRPALVTNNVVPGVSLAGSLGVAATAANGVRRSVPSAGSVPAAAVAGTIPRKAAAAAASSPARSPATRAAREQAP